MKGMAATVPAVAGADDPPVGANDGADADASASCRVSAGLERSLTQVARAILRLGVPQSERADGVAIDRAGYWLLVRVSEQAPVRLSDLADAVRLDLSTVSRQTRALVAAGLLVKVEDPHDGRAVLVSLSDRGRSVLDEVSDTRRELLAEVIADWTDEERNTLATGLIRLGSGLDRVHAGQDGAR